LSLAFVIASDYEDMSRRAAARILDLIRHRPTLTIALPTGETPRRMYHFLADGLNAYGPASSEIRFVNLDEFLGFPQHHPCSFARELRGHLFDRLKHRPTRIRLLDGGADDPAAECEEHEHWIQKQGGLDLAVLGIGANGHIAFNEPGTSFDRRTHVSRLADSTIAEVERTCRAQPVPTHALTMGIRTIVDAKQILLLASGRSKATVLRDALLGDVCPAMPASALQGHSRLAIIADESASGKMPAWFQPNP